MKTNMRQLEKKILLAIVLALLTTGCLGQRSGDDRGRNHSIFGTRIGLPETGKYRDPESDRYHNNNNGAKILTTSHSDFENNLGRKISFMCLARGTPRPHITWFKDGVKVYFHKNLNLRVMAIGNDRLKSILEIEPPTQMDAGTYVCTVENMYSLDRRSFKTDFSNAFY